MQLTPSQLTTLRTKGQSSRLDLFIYEPRVIFTAQVNDLEIDKGARTIAFDNYSGTYTNMKEGMTVKIGTTFGGDEVGRIRLRTPSSGSFTVSENSDIDWQDNQYLTVLNYWQIWPVFPRTIQNPNSAEDVIFYKDYDIYYTGQNLTLGTFVNAGSHHPVMLENHTGTVYYTASGTYNLNGHNSWLQYSWEFEGGIPATSSANTPGLVAYNTPGDYVTKLSVNASGTIDTTYRYVSVRNKIGEGDTTPVKRWTMGDLSGSRQEGGYSVEITVYDQSPITEDCVIMLRSDDWYGSTNESFTHLGSSDAFFVGYVERGSIRYSYDRSYFSFTATSITGLMKQATGFSISVESKEIPYKWFELYDMDVRKAVYHYLRWHSTVLSVADVEFTGTDYKVQFFDADRSSIFDAIDNVMRTGLIGTVCADRTGKIWMEVEPQARALPTGTFTPSMTITRDDWLREPDITENIYDTSSYLELGGVAYSGAITGTFSACLSAAPGLTPAYMGSVDKMSGLIIQSQDQLNVLSGNIWANKNQRFPQIALDMAVNTRNLDIAPYETVQMDILASDTIRNVAINAPYIPSDISYSYDAKNQLLLPNITFQGLVNGVPGDTLLIPPDVGLDDFVNPDFGIPDFPFDLDPLDFAFVTDPFLTDPTSLYPCRNGPYTVNQYGISWSKSSIHGTDADRTAQAYLPCVLHPQFPLGTTTEVTPGITLYGDATWSMVHLYGIVNGNRVVTGVGSGGGTWTFALPSTLYVDGFEIELDAGFGSIITYHSAELIQVGTVQATDDVGISVATTAGLYYSVEGNGQGWEYDTIAHPGDLAYGVRFLEFGSPLYTEVITPTISVFYYLVAGTSHVVVDDSLFTDNAGSSGYYVRNAYINGRNISIGSGYVRNVCPPN